MFTNPYYNWWPASVCVCVWGGGAAWGTAHATDAEDVYVTGLWLKKEPHWYYLDLALIAMWYGVGLATKGSPV